MPLDSNKATTTTHRTTVGVAGTTVTVGAFNLPNGRERHCQSNGLIHYEITSIA
ncbi:hypothetical protein OK016_08965 [Vibrio chagasii]|nr:hypothetical protein [Vibrio chagasii]